MHERTIRTDSLRTFYIPAAHDTYATRAQGNEPKMRCAICNRNTNDQFTICQRCHNQIIDNLDQIKLLTEQAKGWTRRHGNTRLIGVASSNPPLSISLLDAALGLTALNIIERHEKTARHCLDVVPYGPASQARNKDTAATTALFSSIAWLRVNLARLSETPSYQIEELHADARDIASSLHALDPANDAAATILQCPADSPDADGTDCGARLRINPDNLGATIKCPRCQTHWTVDRLIQVALSVDDIEVWCEGESIRAWFGIHQTTLNQWVKDGRITKRGELYSIPDAMRTATAATPTHIMTTHETIGPRP